VLISNYFKKFYCYRLFKRYEEYIANDNQDDVEINNSIILFSKYNKQHIEKIIIHEYNDKDENIVGQEKISDYYEICEISQDEIEDYIKNKIINFEHIKSILSVEPENIFFIKYFNDYRVLNYIAGRDCFIYYGIIDLSSLSSSEKNKLFISTIFRNGKINDLDNTKLNKEIKFYNCIFYNSSIRLKGFLSLSFTHSLFYSEYDNFIFVNSKNEDNINKNLELCFDNCELYDKHKNRYNRLMDEEYFAYQLKIINSKGFDLMFSNITFKNSITVEDSTITCDIDNVCFESYFTLKNCQINKATFTDMTIENDLILNNSTFEEEVIFRDNKIDKNLFCYNATFKNNLKFEIGKRGNTIKGNIIFNNTTVNAGFDLMGLLVNGTMSFLGIKLGENSKDSVKNYFSKISKRFSTKKDLNKISLENFRRSSNLIRNSLDEIGQKYDANKFYILSLLILEEQLKKEQKFGFNQTIFLLKLNKWISLHGESWFRVFGWFVFISIVLAGLDYYYYKSDFRLLSTFLVISYLPKIEYSTIDIIYIVSLKSFLVFYFISYYMLLNLILRVNNLNLFYYMFTT
jgi:hypothetical protein